MKCILANYLKTIERQDSGETKDRARNDITSQRSYPSEAKRRVVPAVPGRFSLA